MYTPNCGTCFLSSSCRAACRHIYKEHDSMGGRAHQALRAYSNRCQDRACVSAPAATAARTGFGARADPRGPAGSLRLLHGSEKQLGGGASGCSGEAVGDSGGSSKSRCGGGCAGSCPKPCRKDTSQGTGGSLAIGSDGREPGAGRGTRVPPPRSTCQAHRAADEKSYARRLVSKVTGQGRARAP